VNHRRLLQVVAALNARQSSIQKKARNTAFAHQQQQQQQQQQHHHHYHHHHHHQAPALSPVAPTAFRVISTTLNFLLSPTITQLLKHQ
jgi:ABC-type nickel/cobalt efflux system permease component RcnA